MPCTCPAQQLIALEESKLSGAVPSNIFELDQEWEIDPAHLTIKDKLGRCTRMQPAIQHGGNGCPLFVTLYVCYTYQPAESGCVPPFMATPNCQAQLLLLLAQSML